MVPDEPWTSPKNHIMVLLATESHEKKLLSKINDIQSAGWFPECTEFCLNIVKAHCSTINFDNKGTCPGCFDTMLNVLGELYCKNPSLSSSISSSESIFVTMFLSKANAWLYAPSISPKSLSLKEASAALGLSTTPEELDPTAGPVEKPA